jgi:hypothetical protein
VVKIMSETLVKHFRAAKIPVIMKKKSFTGDANQSIFQLSVRPATKRNPWEHFWVFPGSEHNMIHISNVDSYHRQLVMHIKEPEQQFVITRYNWSLREHEDVVIKTSAFNRTLLMGWDESHLFVARMPEKVKHIVSVKDAHQALKPAIVHNKQKRSKGRRKVYGIKRQGEWFFIPASINEEKLIQNNWRFIYSRQRISRGGNPHIASKIVEIFGKKYVKGRITHRDHKTLTLVGWYRVVRNTEDHLVVQRSRGINFYD